MDDSTEGAEAMERAANACILRNRLRPSLCQATRDRRFREAFGTSSWIAFLLWCYLDVENEGPAGGERQHLLWALLFLKTYGTSVDLAGRCGVDAKTFQKWMWLFVEKLAKMDVVSIAKGQLGV